MCTVCTILADDPLHHREPRSELALSLNLALRALELVLGQECRQGSAQGLHHDVRHVLLSSCLRWQADRGDWYVPETTQNVADLVRRQISRCPLRPHRSPWRPGARTTLPRSIPASEGPPDQMLPLLALITGI
jgi:hypothetical protein